MLVGSVSTSSGYAVGGNRTISARVPYLQFCTSSNGRRAKSICRGCADAENKLVSVNLGADNIWVLGCSRLLGCVVKGDRVSGISPCNNNVAGCGYWNCWLGEVYGNCLVAIVRGIYQIINVNRYGCKAISSRNGLCHCLTAPRYRTQNNGRRCRYVTGNGNYANRVSRKIGDSGGETDWVR